MGFTARFPGLSRHSSAPVEVLILGVNLAPIRAGRAGFAGFADSTGS
jgi:hypothetical protein